MNVTPGHGKAERFAQKTERPVRILVTGFSPFPGAPLNPTQLLVRQLKKEKWTPFKNSHQVHYEVLATSYKQAEARLRELIRIFLPDVIVQFGLSAKAKGFRLERLARNKVNTRFKDATGNLPENRHVKRNGKESLKGTWPVAKLKTRLKNEGLPVTLSGNAGDYVCNYTYYRVLDELQKRKMDTLAGFVHVPYTKAQLKALKAKTADSNQQKKLEKYEGMAQKELLKGAKLLIRTLAESVKA